ncbi:unnamed protein product [Lasius platythorax]|uniref:Uncharacterized protein n=1 Tax=Lasius platythorax TaxID=488582 RepID=A0AAV2NKE9_9HYME
MVVESLFYKAEFDVRPPPPQQNYLAGDQCSSTDKAMKEHGWDRRLVVLKRGPKMKAEPSSGGFPPFVPAFRFFACSRRSQPQGPAVRAETP